MNADFSLSDIAAITNGNNNDGIFGGNGAWFIIILFLFAFLGWGGNRGGYGGEGGTPYVINAGGGCGCDQAVQRGFDQSAIIGKLDGLNASICSGFNTAELSRANNAANTMQGMNNIAMAVQNCCCENREKIADLKYTVATENCADRTAIQTAARDIIDSQNAGTRAILDKLCQTEIDNLKSQKAEALAEINALRFAQSQTAQNAYFQQALNAQTAVLNPVPIPAYVVQNPNCCAGAVAYNTCG